MNKVRLVSIFSKPQTAMPRIQASARSQGMLALGLLALQLLKPQPP